jgi:hypothetical protein
MVKSRRTKRILSEPQSRVRKWILAHRGLVTQIAERCSVTEQFVSMVAYGRTEVPRGHPVERMLRNKGWISPIRG